MTRRQVSVFDETLSPQEILKSTERERNKRVGRKLIATYRRKTNKQKEKKLKKKRGRILVNSSV
jgi:hypothetical protein